MAPGCKVTFRLRGKLPAPEGPGLRWTRLGSNGFGAVVTGLKPQDLQAPKVRRKLVDLWRGRRGLLVLRGLQLSPEELVDLTGAFGEVEEALAASRVKAQVQTTPGHSRRGVVMRLGNSRDPATGEPNGSFTASALLRSATGTEACQFNCESKQPNWHTDGTFRQRPPTGSALYAIQVPPTGGDTCFADASRAFETLPIDTQRRLEGLEAVCSQAHHDALHNVKKPGTYTLMSPEQRMQMPLMAVPLVLTHPETQRKSLYGANSSVFRLQSMNSPAPPSELLERAEGPEAYEDPSVDELRSLLPHATGPELVIRWHWDVGDLVVWDNRCTMHCATGFDHQTFVREMWRTTFHDMSWQPPVRQLSRE
ncbi:unnamed protein product [Durusdinium trenchii]|uniref:TauD/TfdA-like domain-containing protein n=1 Tax=Durusdinium trenchii TaxID=1381693 RepID=A0ABP0L202_9DINO